MITQNEIQTIRVTIISMVTSLRSVLQHPRCDPEMQHELTGAALELLALGDSPDESTTEKILKIADAIKPRIQLWQRCHHANTIRATEAVQVGGDTWLKAQRYALN